MTVISGASLQLNGTAGTYAGYALTIGGVGYGKLPSGNLLLDRGALVNLGTANTWTGNITLSADTTLAATTAALTVTGNISGGFSITKVGANAATLAAPNSYTGNLTVSAGTLTLQGANTYTGSTTVGTTANLTLNNLGTITGTSSPITVNAGGTLAIDNSTAALVANRLGGVTKALTLNGGNFTLIGNNGVALTSSESIGALTLGSGNNVITSTSGTFANAAINLLRFDSLTRSSGATANFVAGSTGADLGTALNQVLFTNAPSTTAVSQNGGAASFNILPYATVTSKSNVADIASFNPTGGTGVAALATSTANDVVRLTGATTMAANASAAALVLQGGATGFTVNQGGFRLTLGGSGTIVSNLTTTGTNTITAGTLALGSNEGIVLTTGNVSIATVINSPITTSGGLTVGGNASGSTTLAATNNIGGDTSIQLGGTLTLGSAASVGAGNLTITGTTAITPIITNVIAAFRAFGFSNAGTPLLIASTPVNAVHPEANARTSSGGKSSPFSANQRAIAVS